MSKTKQTYMRAVMPTVAESNAKNYNNDKELVGYTKLIDKKTERTVIDARWYMGKSAKSTAVYCSIWCMGQGVYDAAHSTSGRGVASGYGYHKRSASADSAIRSAGIELFGSPYGHPVNGTSPADTKKLLKKHAHIGGCGDGSVDCALAAIAYAMGYKDCITVQG